MKNNLGFSLIELVVTLLLIALLMAFAVPSFDSLTTRTRIDSELSALRNAFMLARDEAITRQTPIGICSSNDGQKCAPLPNWSQGWLVFEDQNNNGGFEVNETLLRVWEEGVKQPGTLTQTVGNAVALFDTRGALVNPLSFSLKPKPTCLEEPARTINVDRLGRFTIAMSNC